MQNLLAVGLGGFLGAIARYTLGGFVQSRVAGRFPWGTLAVNVLGCAAAVRAVLPVERSQNTLQHIAHDAFHSVLCIDHGTRCMSQRYGPEAHFR